MFYWLYCEEYTLGFFSTLEKANDAYKAHLKSEYSIDEGECGKLQQTVSNPNHWSFGDWWEITLVNELDKILI